MSNPHTLTAGWHELGHWTHDAAVHTIFLESNLTDVVTLAYLFMHVASTVDKMSYMLKVEARFTTKSSWKQPCLYYDCVNRKRIMKTIPNLY